MNIIVIFNHDSSNDPVVSDSVKTAHAIAQNLKVVGHQTELFELTNQSVFQLSSLRPDVFFNQAWGIGADENSEDKVVQLLEKTGIPVTGASAQGIQLSADKTKTKTLLAAAHIPTPKFQVVNKLKLPVIVKPSQEDCSLGISQSSIYNEPILIEEYIEGRELSVTILGNEVLPISEITFGPSFKNKYKIVDFAAKWEQKSVDYKDTVGVCPAKLSLVLTKKIRSLALAVFKLTKCRDYARIDMRLSPNGVAYVLEVNANPAIGPGDGAVRSAAAASYSYPQFLDRIVQVCLRRRKGVKLA